MFYRRTYSVRAPIMAFTFSLAAAMFLSGCNSGDDTATASSNLGPSSDTCSISDVAQLNGTVAEKLESGSPAAEIKTALQDRARKLRQNARRNPRLIAQARLNADLLARVPAGAKECLEKEVEEDGEVEVLASFSDTNSSESLQYFFRSEDGKKRELHFGGETPDLLTGTRVRVRGVALPVCGTTGADGDTEALVVGSEADSIEIIQATPPASGFGVQNIGVVLLNFSDQTTSYTQAQARDIVFNKTSNYWLEASYGQTSAAGNVHGPFTISLSKAGCDTDRIASLADAVASQNGINMSQYRRIMYVFPKNGCTFYGRANVGGNPSRSWINGSLVLHTVAHELGHNLGLYHSNALNCGSSIIGSSCSSIEYGDTTDVMGNKLAGHYTAFQKERLGWLNYGSSPQIRTVTSSGSFALEPFNTQSNGVKALKVIKSVDSSGRRTYYYIEYRQPTGVDATLGKSTSYNLTKGVIIHTGSEASSNSSYLLNMNPASGSWYQAALNPGQTFQDNSARVSITLTAAGTSGATVSVNIGGTPAPTPSPTSPASPLPAPAPISECP